MNRNFAQYPAVIENEEDEDEQEMSDFQKELRLTDTLKLQQFLNGHFKFDTALEMWVIFGFSDFTGTSIERSNARYLLSKYPHIVTDDRSDTFNAATIGIHKDDLDNISPEAQYSLYTDLHKMNSAGVLDDRLYQEVQQERQAESWTQWIGSNFVTGLILKFREPQLAHTLTALRKNPGMRGLFEEARDLSGQEWVEHKGAEFTIDVDSVVNSVTRQMLQRWLAQMQPGPQHESLMEGHDFSCLMIPAPPDLADAVTNWGQMFVTPDVLYVDPEDPEDHGLEDDIHVTVKFGLHDAELTEELLRIIEETPPFEIEIGPCTLFDTDDRYDVVKFDVDSDALRELNARISELPNSDSHPDYHPHMTVAYVIKGTCNELIGKPLLDPEYEPALRFLVKTLIFSSKNKTQTTLFLGKPNLEPEPHRS